jgi:hypothetical protein
MVACRNSPGIAQSKTAAKPSAPEPEPKAVAAAAPKKHARTAKRCLPGSGEAGRRSLWAASLQALFGGYWRRCRSWNLSHRLGCARPLLRRDRAHHRRASPEPDRSGSRQ